MVLPLLPHIFFFPPWLVSSSSARFSLPLNIAVFFFLSSYLMRAPQPLPASPFLSCPKGAHPPRQRVGETPPRSSSVWRVPLRPLPPEASDRSLFTRRPSTRKDIGRGRKLPFFPPKLHSARVPSLVGILDWKSSFPFLLFLGRSHGIL